MNQRTYIAIDLKSFYASVECVERGLDPLQARLVVADDSRTDKTICLAVSPALKAYGIPGRPRLFEVKQRIAQLKRENPRLELDFVTAKPRMAKYLEVSGQVYSVYLRHIAPEDIHVYSIDEVFIDATEYLRMYSVDAHTLAMRLIQEVLKETGVTATAGIGPNMYLAKVAMDIEAKHRQADKDGVRIAELDFWRIGHGTEARLASAGMFTLGDVARMSLNNEEVLYKLFGINAELLIDHAWGWEPCTMADIKRYRPSASSLSSGQVLMEPYSFEKARTIVREMTDLLSLDLVDKRLVTTQLVLHVGYEAGTGNGPMVKDWYGRPTPKPAHGSVNLPFPTSATSILLRSMMELYDKIVDKKLSVRRVYVVASQVKREEEVDGLQMSLFDDVADTSRERRQQEAILEIRRKFGKNAILKGMNFEEGATTRDRNQQIGGHHE